MGQKQFTGEIVSGGSHKSRELEKIMLDYWVGKVEDHVGDAIKDFGIWSYHKNPDGDYYRPHIDWEDTGPLIDKYDIELQKDIQGGWLANKWPVDGNDGSSGNYLIHGKTPQIAICRCVVVSVFGEEVPDET